MPLFWRAAAAYALFFAAFFSPVLLTGRYFGDAADQLIETLPLYGRAPALWEPRTMLGFPMFADPNQVFWYPLAWLRAVPGSFDAFLFFAIVIAAAGAFGLARSLTGSTAGAAIAGLVYALSGFFIGHMGHADLIHPAAWVPYVLWGLLESRSPPRRRWEALCAIALAFTCLSGQPQIFVYTLYLAAAFACVSAFGAEGGARAYLGRSAATLALGCGLAAIAIVPALELAARSVRGNLSYHDFMGFEAVAGALPVRLFFPYLLGGRPLAPYASAYDVGWFAETSAYVGTATLALALAGVIAMRRDRFALFWLAVVILSLGVTFDGPLAAAAYRLPGLSLFKAPGRHAFEFALAIGMLAAYGAAAIESGRAGIVRIAACCGLVAACSGLTFVAIRIEARAFVADLRAVAGPVSVSLDPLKNAAFWMPALGFLAGAAALVAWARAPRSRAAAPFAVAALALELGSFGWFGYWNAGAFPRSLLVAPFYTERLRAQLTHTAQRVLTPQTDHLGTGIPPNLNLLWDVSSLRGYVPLELARTAAVLPLQSLATTLPLFAPADRRLDETGVRYVVVPGDAPSAMAAPLRADPQRFRELSDTGSDHVFENMRAYPRAWIARSAIPASASAARSAFVDSAFDARATAYAEGLPAAEAARARDGRGNVAIDAVDFGRVQLRIECARACFVVTSDVAYPGWTAAVDGMRQPIYSVDYVFRGVLVPPGRHVVALRYVPRSLELGAGVSILSLLALGALVGRRDPRPKAASSIGIRRQV